MVFPSRHSGWKCALVAAAWLLGFAAQGRAEGLSERLVRDAADSRLDVFDCAAAAFIASGVESEQELAPWLALYHLREKEILAAARMEHDVPLPHAIHRALHERVLTGRYRAEATDLRVTLAEGDFNCLSSLARYYDLCQTAGIEVEIWLRRGHVYARLPDEQPPVIVEPGARDWMVREDEQPSSGARRLGAVELLGKFYYNRGVELLQQGEFARGLSLLEIGTQLDPGDSDARSNLVAGLNNWAVARFRDRQFAEAAVLIERGLKLDAQFAPLVANERLVRAMLGE
jgi:hypothetical protein